MLSKRTVTAFVSGFTLACATLALAPAAPVVLERGDSQDDREALIAKLHSIFDAFVERDAEALRRTHTSDWIGFKAHSRELVRGLDGYMSTVAFDNPMLEYRFDELEVELHGDLALVWYVATWKNRLTAHDLTMTMTARSLDVYRRENGEWIQAGSHLATVPRPGALQHLKSDEIFEVSFE